MASGLFITIGETLDDLIEHVVERLAVQTNPLERRTIVVPNSSVSQWLEQQLAQRLGRSEGRRDGVVANLETIYPSSIENRYLYNEKRERDVWSVERLALALLDERAAASELTLGDALRRAKELSDVLMLRPESLDHYLAGAENFRERRVVEGLRAAGTPPPFEALDRFDAREHALSQSGLIVFGCNELTTGGLFPQLLGRLAQCGEVHVMLSTPSLPITRALVAGQPVDTLASRWGARAMAHIQTWIASSNPTSVTWLEPASGTPGYHPDHAALTAAIAEPNEVAGEVRPTTLLSVHGAVGFARQVEIARDALLHCIKELDVRPHDIRIITTDPQRFAPLMEALWGWRRDDNEAPWLQFEAADPALPRASDRLDAFRQLLRTIDSHFTASDVLGVLAQPAIQRGIGLKRSDIDRITDLVVEAGVSVGLDAATRRGLGVFDADDDGGTWERFIDRTLLASVFEHESPDEVVEGSRRFEVRPVGAPEDLESFSRISRAVKLLRTWSEECSTSKPLEAWVDIFRDWTSVIGRDERVVDNALERSIEKLNQLATFSTAELEFREARSLFERQAAAIGGSTVLGRGGAPVVDIHALASTRARVTCFLGIDEDLLPAPFSPPAHLGEPRPGDPSPRERFRSDLLATIVSTTDRVIFLTNDRNVKDGSPINIALPLQELSDALRQGGGGHAGLEMPVRRHPRHVFTARLAPQDPSAPVELDLAEVSDESFSFDPAAAVLAAANFYRAPKPPDADMPFAEGEYGVTETPDVIDLAHVLRFFKQPQQQYLATRVNGARVDEQRDELPAVPRLAFEKGLEAWGVRNEYVRGLLEGTGGDNLSDHIDGTLAKIAPGMRRSAVKQLDLPTYRSFAASIRQGLEELDAQREPGSEFPAALSGLTRPTSRPPVSLYRTEAGLVVLEWTVSSKPHSSLLGAILDMAASTLETGESVRAMILYPYTDKKKADYPTRFVRLAWSGSNHRQAASTVLERATDLYLELQRDVPLFFPKTNLGELALESLKPIHTAASDAWNGLSYNDIPGEKDDPERRLLFPLDFSDLKKVRDGRFAEIQTKFRRLFDDLDIKTSHAGKDDWVEELRGA